MSTPKEIRHYTDEELSAQEKKTRPYKTYDSVIIGFLGWGGHIQYRKQGVWVAYLSSLGLSADRRKEPKSETRVDEGAG